MADSVLWCQAWFWELSKRLSLLFLRSLWVRCYYPYLCPHVTDEEPEVQGGKFFVQGHVAGKQLASPLVRHLGFQVHFLIRSALFMGMGHCSFSIRGVKGGAQRLPACGPACSHVENGLYLIPKSMHCEWLKFPQSSFCLFGKYIKI